MSGRGVFILFGLMIVAAGAVLGIVYPRLAERSLGPELGSWQVYTRMHDIVTPEATLRVSDGATAMTLVIVSVPQLRAGLDRELLTLSVIDEEGVERFHESIRPPSGGALESPQTGVVRYRIAIGTLQPAAGLNRFVFAKGRNFDPSIWSVDLVLNAAVQPVQPYAREAGLGLIAFGLLVIGLGVIGGGGERRNPNSSPPPKWGRG